MPQVKGHREVWIMHKLMLMSHYCSWIEWMWKIDRNLIMIVYVEVHLQIEAVVVAVVIVVAIWYTFDGSRDFTKSRWLFWTISGQWRLQQKNHFHTQNKYSKLVVSALPADGLTMRGCLDTSRRSDDHVRLPYTGDQQLKGHSNTVLIRYMCTWNMK